ncbi:MAG: hypothetical protein ABIR37_02955 [Candidatus Saccharimonadales bacterium]
MAEQEFQPPKYVPDIMAWESELDLPPEFRNEFAEDANPFDSLLRAELDDHDSELKTLVEGLGRVGLFLGECSSHTLPKRDGYFRLGVSGLTKSKNYVAEQCMLVVFADVQHDVFSQDSTSTITLENYFVDCERSMITKAAAVVEVGDYRLPEDAPYMFWRNDKGGRLVCGTEHTIAVPSSIGIMDYETIKDSRQNIACLKQRLSMFGAVTFDQ